MLFSTITSPKNDRVKAVIKLRRRKHRNKQGRMLIDGARELSRALDAEVDAAEIYVCPELCESDESRRLLERLETLKMSVFQVTPTIFGKLAYGERADGFVAVAFPPNLSLKDLHLPENPLVCVIEAVEKPGNLGAVVRCADGAGVSAVILADPRTDIYNPNAIRASIGAIFSVPVCAASTEDVQSWLRQQRLQVFTARVDGERDYCDIDLTRRTAIVLGSEAHGLSDDWQAADMMPIRLPMRGAADSLNVSVTAAILFYEARRQRNAERGSRNSGGSD